ncbi:MAG: UDP-N-acetylglucosamine 1-carboxyvinyltransferase [Planctomycetota bacterium]
MDVFRIEGGHPLRGSIAAAGNKNAALPLAALAVMLDGPLHLKNLPRIGDVEAMLALLAEIGVEVEEPAPHEVVLQASGIRDVELKSAWTERLRGSVLLAAPLLTRFGRVYLPFPGGDRIGRRRIDTHLLALEAMGAKVALKPQGYAITCRGRLHGADILLDEASVTATENTVMAAACADGETVIRNAACEPHVQELCRALVSSGASIEGVGTNRLVIRGVRTLSGAAVEIGADYIEVGSLIALAAVTGSEIAITRASPGDLRMILLQFRRLGIAVEVRGESVRVPAGQPLEVRPDVRGAIPKLEDAPWPGFPADLMSIVTVAASQAKGSLLVFEKLFESRMFFVDQLITMGARIVLCDPHRAVVVGPSPLHGSEIHSPDIRAGMALLIASLAAEGKSLIRNVSQIDRGYETIDRRLNALGARIERVRE